MYSSYLTLVCLIPFFFFFFLFINHNRDYCFPVSASDEHFPDGVCVYFRFGFARFRLQEKLRMNGPVGWRCDVFLRFHCCNYIPQLLAR